MLKDLKSQSLAITILALACILAAYLLAYPAVRNALSSNTELKNLETQQQTLSTAQQELEAFLVNFEKLADKAQIAGAALPDEPDLPVLLSNIDEMARLAGVALAGLSVTESTTETTPASAHALRSADIEITASGSYPSFKDFLLRMEHHLRLIDIQKLSFQVDSSNFIRFGISIKTYYQR
jgi:hypothetical protein